MKNNYTIIDAQGFPIKLDIQHNGDCNISEVSINEAMLFENRKDAYDNLDYIMKVKNGEINCNVWLYNTLKFPFKVVGVKTETVIFEL